MRENKLYYQSEKFNLKTCNYLVSAFLNDENNLVVCPNYKYFNSDWETNYETEYPENQIDANDQLRAHFKIIKDMGFNSVRIMNCQVRTRWDSDILTTRLFFKNYQTETNPDPERENGTYGVRIYEILTDLNTEHGKEYYIQIMSTILNIAEEFDLKVIWVLGGEWDYVDANNITHNRSLLTSQNTTIYNQFTDFVEDVAQEFKSNTTLIGYDLFNELKSFNNSTSNINYYDLSNTVKGIVEAIKTSDNNHFITVGLININNFYTLGVKPFYHTDIYSFHLYEAEYDNHEIPLGGEINRQLKYFSTLEHPWMIGETGYNTYGQDTNDLSQRNYIGTTGFQAFSCNSLGYSWWELYDMDYGTKRWGILSRSSVGENINIEGENINIYGNFKRSIDYNFNNDLSSSVFHIIENTNNSCSFPMDSYYNFFPIVGEQELKTWDGFVKDGENTIADAIVKISVLYDDPDSDNPNDLKLYDFFTFTNSAGHFSLTIPTTDNKATISVTKYGYNINTRNDVYHSSHILHTNDDPFELTQQSLPTKFQTINSIFVEDDHTVILDKPTMITGAIYVFEGGVLRISSTICFDDNSQLKIYPGGKVILEDGAVLTAIHEFWYGITMWNFNDLEGNIPDSYLESKGKTLIANAFQGISSHYSNHINLNGTKFINNYRDVYITRNNFKVIFKNCDFILTEDALEQFSISGSCDDHVKVDWSKSISFTNCHFEDNRQYGNPPNKTGIYVYNVDTLQVLPDPLMSSKRSYFKNLHYGIYAFSECGSGIIVKNCDFNTVRGIYLYNYQGFFLNKIVNNNFNIKNYNFPITTDTTKLTEPDDPVPPEDEYLYRPYGIYIDEQTDKYQIEGNTFLAEGGSQITKYGIVVNHNGAMAKELYRNNFVNLENAVQSINLNRNTSNGNTNGLQILCNNFNNIKTDIYVTSEADDTYTNWGIAAYQGSPSSPASNLFSTNTPPDCLTYNNEASQITYFTRSNIDPYWNPREWPDTISSKISIIPLYFGNISSNACPDNTTKLPIPIDEELMRIEMSNAKSLETAIKSMLNDIVDGGNTGQILSSVLHLDDNSAWLTYYELMDYSPYLSDTVLKEVAKKEQGLTAPMIRDILFANPQGIKNKDLQKMLKDRDNPLPDYMIEQIESGLGIISAKENLEIQLAEQQLIYEENLKILVEYYMSISDKKTWAEDSIYNLLDGSKDPRFMYLLADYYLSKYDYAKAKIELNRILQFCELSENEIRENRDLFDFYNLYSNLMKKYKNDLSHITRQSDINQLRAFEMKGGLAGTKARVILMYNNATDYREAVYTPVAPLEDRSIKSDIVNNNNPYFSVYPNPAKEYFYLEYSLPEILGTMQVVVSDITGKMLMQKQIYELRDIIIIKTADLLPGTYNCTLYNGNKSVYNGKIIVE